MGFGYLAVNADLLHSAKVFLKPPLLSSPALLAGEAHL